MGLIVVLNCLEGYHWTVEEASLCQHSHQEVTLLAQVHQRGGDQGNFKEKHIGDANSWAGNLDKVPFHVHNEETRLYHVIDVNIWDKQGGRQ